MIHGSYELWRTGDHRPGGLLLVRAPGVRGGAALDPIAIEDVGPTLASAFEMDLPDVDGRPAAWVSRLRADGTAADRPPDPAVAQS
jgi:hypothetical protein